jgi:hypothetical protein
MTARVLLTGLLAGTAMFVWSGIAHMALPLGEAGVREIPNEKPALNALQAALGESSGLYLFPGMGLGPDATAQQKTAAMQDYGKKLAANPSGVLMYHPPGATPPAARMFITEFLTELVEAILAVWLMAQARLGSFASRFGFVLVLGFMASLMTNVQYWNWYGFPTNYTAAYVFTEFMGFVVAGLIAAAMVKTEAPKSAAVAA